MKVDIIKLLTIFDELMRPHTDEDNGIYWFRSTRPADGIFITLIFSLYDGSVSVIISVNDIAVTSIEMKKCSEIHVLDQERKCLEIIHDNQIGRCFLALNGESILDYTS